MRMRFFLAMATALCFAGCGGRVLPHGSGGAGAAGGAGGSPPGSGGGAEGGMGGAKPSPTSTTGATAGTGGASPSCDAIGDCGNMSNGCLGCSFAGPCENEAEACYQDQDCGDYQSCIGDCTKGDLACTAACKQQHPAGAEEFDHLYVCAVCDHCAKSCADTAMLCPSPSP